MSERILTFVTSPPGRRVRPRQVERDALCELDRVRVLADVEADEGVMVPAGSIGTVVAIWAGGAAYEVEFTRPVDALATIRLELLELVERAAD